MTIRREDLAAAAAVGLLHYTQIDPLLVFLLQRDVRGRREAMLAQLRSARRGRLNLWLSYVASLLGLVTAALFTVLFVARAEKAMDAGALFLFAMLCSAGMIALASWLRKCGFCARARIVLTLASVSIAALALYHVGS